MHRLLSAAKKNILLAVFERLCNDLKRSAVLPKRRGYERSGSTKYSNRDSRSPDVKDVVRVCAAEAWVPGTRWNGTKASISG